MPDRDVVLVAEDSDDDYFFLERAARLAAADVRLHRVADGQQAIDYLSEAYGGQNSRTRMPKLLLLDLKMPTLDGFEVLQWLSMQDELKNVPVVVLSNSALRRDIRKAYELGANGFAKKADTFDQLKEQVSCLRGYWIQQNRTCHGPE